MPATRLVLLILSMPLWGWALQTQAALSADAVCQQARLTAAATWCRQSLACGSTFYRNPDKDPGGFTRQACELKALSRLTQAYVKTDDRANEACPQREDGTVISKRLQAEMQSLTAYLDRGWQNGAAENGLFRGLETSGGRFCAAWLKAEAVQAVKPDLATLTATIDKSANQALDKLQDQINAAAGQGVNYAGSAEQTVGAVQHLGYAAASALGGRLQGTRLAAGAIHICAELEDGAVKCWGDNRYGQLGLGDIAARGDNPNEMGANLPAVDLGAGRRALQLAAGVVHTCALLDDGTVKCWGHNDEGQLGLGDTASRGDDPNEMGANLPAVDLGAGRRAVQLAANGSYTCALLDNGTVKCWGSNFYGQLGLGDTVTRGDNGNEMGANLPAVDLGAGRQALQLTAGVYHSCALLDDGAVKCWGLNSAGQLGLGDTAARGDNANEMGANLPSVDLSE